MVICSALSDIVPGRQPATGLPAAQRVQRLALDSQIGCSLAHDAGYQLIEEGFLPVSERVYVDQLLCDICIEDEMPELIAKNAVFKAVQKFGLSHIRSKKILTAP